MATIQRGDLVEWDGLLAVVVGLGGDPNIPEEHVAVWFGDPRCHRTSHGGRGGERPEVWTVPAEYCSPAAPPIYRH
jgi:hypothetical protein